MDTKESIIESLRLSIAEWEARLPRFRAQGEAELVANISLLIAETKKLLEQMRDTRP